MAATTATATAATLRGMPQQQMFGFSLH